MTQKIEFRKAQLHEFSTYNYVVTPGQVVGKKKKVRLFGKDFWVMNPATKKLEKYTIDVNTDPQLLKDQVEAGNVYLPKQ